MATVQQLEKEIREIKQRNKRVEADKAWETSLERKIIIALLTYAVIVLLFWAANVQNYWFNALIPTLGFILSTLSLPFFKQLWLSYKH
ncbi:MAG: hypothetical protein V1722_00455 [Candidatus Micrarchaeota archaeon]